MEKNTVHHLLVNTGKLQTIPAWGIAFALVIAAGIVAALWGDWRSGGVYLLSMSLDWGILWMLPRAGRSYGPDRPATLALAFVSLILAAIPDLLRLPLAVLGGLLILKNGLVFYSTWIAPFRLGVTQESFGKPTTDKPLRLLHIGDIHVERITARERKLNQLIAELQPDVIVFSGDFVNVSYTYDPVAEENVRAVIREWHAPLGVYCVGGTYTVEPVERVRAFCAGMDNLRLLENEWVTLDTPQGKFAICGMQTTHKLHIDRVTVESLWRERPPTDKTLLLTHAPDVAPEASALGFDLYLCGHTHGGQIRFPLIGATFTGSAYGRRFAMGRYELPPMTLYTTRGVGLEGMGAPRARFLCPPEITLWEISITPETR